MKKVSHYLLIFGLIFLFSCTPSNKKPPKGLEGTWLSVSNRKGIWGGSGLFDGFFMEIKPGERIHQYAYNNNINHDAVNFNDSAIINLQDSSIIKIEYVGSDSIQLIFPWDTTLVTYVKLPFKETGLIKIKESDLLQNEWYLLDGNEKFRVEFINYDLDISNHDKSLKLGFNILNWGQYFGWDIMDFDDHTYLISSAYSIFEPMVYQITDFSNDTISLSYFDTYFTKDFKEINLVKSKPLSNEKFQQKVSKLADHKFKLIDYSFEGYYDTIGYDTVILKRINRFFTKFGIEKEMTFKFTKDSLFITNNIGGEYSKGAWELSKDGEIIKVVTKNGYMMIGIIAVPLKL